MLKRIGAALALALLVAACGVEQPLELDLHSGRGVLVGERLVVGAGDHSASTSSASSSTATAPPATSSSSTSSASSSSSSSSSSASHTHTQPPNPTPHFVVKLKIGAGDTLTPPSVAIGGHTLVDLSVANDSGSTVKLALAHGSKTVFSRSLPTGSTTVKLPALAERHLQRGARRQAARDADDRRPGGPVAAGWLSRSGSPARRRGRAAAGRRRARRRARRAPAPRT